MSFFQPFVMAIKSMMRNKGRSVLTMLGIIIGVAAVIILVSLVQFMTKQVTDQMEMMGTNRIDINYYAEQDISKELHRWIKEHDDLFEGVTPAVQTSTDVKYKSKSLQMSVTFGSEQYALCNNYEMDSGAMFTEMQVNAREKVAVVGSGVAKNLFGYVDPIGKELKIKGEKFTVIGVFKEKGDSSENSYYDMIVVVPYTRQRTLMRSTKIENFIVKATSSETTIEATEKLNEYLKGKLGQEWKYYVSTNNTWVDEVKKQTGMMSAVLGGIAGISLLVGGIGIMNIMLVTVTERTREIGIRRAIGAKRRDIVVQFLIESGTVSALGGIAGMLLGSFVTLVLGKLLFQDIVLPAVGMLLGAFAFSAVIGIFFGFYPAFRASKLSPIDALRSE